MFGFYLREKDVSDHQIEESLPRGGNKGERPAWRMALDSGIGNGEKAKPVERIQSWNSMDGGGALRFSAWTTVCLSEGIN